MVGSLIRMPRDMANQMFDDLRDASSIQKHIDKIFGEFPRDPTGARRNGILLALPPSPLLLLLSRVRVLCHPPGDTPFLPGGILSSSDSRTSESGIRKSFLVDVLGGDHPALTHGMSKREGPLTHMHMRTRGTPFLYPRCTIFRDIVELS